MSNKSLGNSFETELCNLLSVNGFWVHNFAVKSEGQPADIIAVKDQKAYLIDCKVCTNNTFPLSRIEGNQHLSMAFWQSCGNDDAWFALKTDDGINMMAYSVIQMIKNAGKSVLSHSMITRYSIGLREWLIDK